MGNTIEHFREKAQLYEEVYAVSLDLEAETYKVESYAERSYAGKPKVVRQVKLTSGKDLAGVTIGELEMQSPFVFFLGPKGIQQE